MFMAVLWHSLGWREEEDLGGVFKKLLDGGEVEQAVGVQDDFDAILCFG
jgi:hypothetical protein